MTTSTISSTSGDGMQIDTEYSHSSTITLQMEGERFRDFNLCNVSETWGVQTWQIVKLKPEVEDWS